jgi:hypothetical protein
LWAKVPIFGSPYLIKNDFMKNIKSKKAEEQLNEIPGATDAPLNKALTKPINDGMNTPVPDKVEPAIRSASEAALYKQAENPLGNPDKK